MIIVSVSFYYLCTNYLSLNSNFSCNGFGLIVLVATLFVYIRAQLIAGVLILTMVVAQRGCHRKIQIVT